VHGHSCGILVVIVTQGGHDHEDIHAPRLLDR
jgi:hypothetical protein